MTAAICDDDRAWLDYAAGKIKTYADEQHIEMELCCFEDVASLLEYQEKIFDVVFLDIVFEEVTAKFPESGDLPETESSLRENRGKGLRAAREMNRISPNTRIVYLTNYLYYAVDVYETRHIWFLTKDRFEEKLPVILQKVENEKELAQDRFIFHAEDQTTVNLPAADILYLERYGRRTKIVSVRGDYYSRERIPVLMQQLPQEMFGRCHNSFLVSMPRVKELHRTTLKMENGEEIMISRGHSTEFHRQFLSWAQRQHL